MSLKYTYNTSLNFLRMNNDTNTSNEYIFLVDSATTHTILKNKLYFSNLVNRKTDVSTISDTSEIIEGSRRANAFFMWRNNIAHR